jgi:hypothetical protein
MVGSDAERNAFAGLAANCRPAQAGLTVDQSEEGMASCLIGAATTAPVEIHPMATRRVPAHF